MNKRILITQNALANIVGGEIAVLEMAKYFRGAGADVVVYTWYFGGDMKKYFDEANIPVIWHEDGADTLSIVDFDYVWVHNQVLPPSFVRELTKSRRKLPYFFFQHLSPLDTSPLDQPYIFDLEIKLSSLSTFISEKTREKLINQFFGNKLNGRTALLRNPVPVDFHEPPTYLNRQKILKRVLIVSNHPPEEINQASAQLRDRGYEVTSIGQAMGGERVLVSPELLRSYDCVVTIGKTVQYSLCAGVPVYVYDHYGGPGYLKEQNYVHAGMYNFSGRSQDSSGQYITTKKTADTITKEIIEGYGAAYDFQYKNQERFIEEYSIAITVPNLMKTAQKVTVKKFEKEYANYVIAAQYMVKKYTQEINVVYRERVQSLEDRISLELSELEKARSEIRRLKAGTSSRDVGIKQSVRLVGRALRKKISK